MEITKHKEGKGLIIAVKGRLDAVTSPAFDKEMEEILVEGETALVVDFEHLEYISSAGLRSILAVTKQLKAKNGRIVLASLKDIVREVFEISGFNKIIPIYASREEAVSNL
jgi:anti-anti-sigma factor